MDPGPGVPLDLALVWEWFQSFASKEFPIVYNTIYMCTRAINGIQFHCTLYKLQLLIFMDRISKQSKSNQKAIKGFKLA